MSWPLETDRAEPSHSTHLAGAVVDRYVWENHEADHNSLHALANVLNGGAVAAAFTIGDETADTINVAIQLNDAAGDPLSAPAVVVAFLSADSAGLGIEGSAPTDVTIGTDGAIIAELVTDTCWILQSEADGDIDLDIDLTDPGVDTYYLVVVLAGGSIAVSDAITFADQS
jgi:hypothetical protein